MPLASRALRALEAKGILVLHEASGEYKLRALAPWLRTRRPVGRVARRRGGRPRRGMGGRRERL